jgi:hypothetical protein
VCTPESHLYVTSVFTIRVRVRRGEFLITACRDGFQLELQIRHPPPGRSHLTIVGRASARIPHRCVCTRVGVEIAFRRISRSRDQSKIENRTVKHAWQRVARVVAKMSGRNMSTRNGYRSAAMIAETMGVRSALTVKPRRFFLCLRFFCCTVPRFLFIMSEISLKIIRSHGFPLGRAH